MLDISVSNLARHDPEKLTFIKIHHVRHAITHLFPAYGYGLKKFHTSSFIKRLLNVECYCNENEPTVISRQKCQNKTYIMRYHQEEGGTLQFQLQHSAAVINKILSQLLFVCRA